MGTGAGQGRDVQWDDGKEPGALRTIGEVGQALGIRQHVLRYWEEQFPMLRPLKRSGGRRYYRPLDIALLQRIDRLVHQEGYTLRGARAVLEAEAGKGAPAPVPAFSKAPPAPANASAAGGHAAVMPESSPAPGLAGEHGGAPVAPDLLERLHVIRARLAAALAV